MEHECFARSTAPHVPPLIPAWDCQPIRLDDTPYLDFKPLHEGHITDGQRKEEEKGMIRGIRGEGREGDRERETVLRLHPDQREC